MSKSNDNTTTVTLDYPIKRGDTEITEITLIRPNSGSLRGTTLTALMEMDVIALSKILPRISSPALVTEDVQKMPPSDLVQLGMGVLGFLLPNSAKDDLPTA